jgi:hypothetical protein
MPRPWLAWRRYGAAASMVAMVAAFWIWVLAVTRLNIETRGLGGFVTAMLWTLYLFGVPLAALLALSTGVLGAIRRGHSWRFAAVVIAFVATTVAFWWWSIMRAGA